MAEIKTNKMHLERPIKIKRRAFDALNRTHTTWKNLDSSSAIQGPRLNRNDSHSMHFMRAVDRRGLHPICTIN